MHLQKTFPARNVIAFLALCIFTLSAVGQTPTPTQVEETIRVNTDLIQTNVTVVDKNNRFVDGLKREQFEVRVDGKLVPLEFFEQISSSSTRTNDGSPNNVQKSAAAAANPVFRDRKIIFFVDDLHISLDSLTRTRSAILRFIEEEMMPGDIAMIVSASGQLGFLQQFTDNKAVLRAAAARLRVFPNNIRDGEQPPMPEYAALRIVNGDRDAAAFFVDKIMQTNAGPVGINRNAAYLMVRNRANVIVATLASVTGATLGSLENLLQAASRINGRKLVFFASDGFLLESKNGNLTTNLGLQRVINWATRSGSVIYTIDTHGLFSITSADATGDRPMDPLGRLDNATLGEGGKLQDGLFVIANESGGRFLKNQNYFDEWIDQILDENANYYALAWSPESEEQTGKRFKRIEVSIIGRPELIVRLPGGYLKNSEQDAVKKKKNEKAPSEKKTTKSIAASVTPDAAPPKNLPTVLLLNYLDVPNVGAVLTSSVKIETGGLDYGDNRQTAKIDVAGVVLNDKGKQVADFKTGLSVASSRENTAQSVIYNNRTPLAPGIYQVRVGTREPKTGQVGAATQWIEIPDLAKRKLTLGTLLLGVEELKKSVDSADTQIQFSVDHKFARPLQFNFMSFIYNAARAANGEINLATKIEIFDSQGRIVVNTPVRPLPVKGIDDAGRIPLTGTIKQQTTAPGTYLLRVTVNDLAGNTSVVQQAIFYIE